MGAFDRRYIASALAFAASAAGVFGGLFALAWWAGPAGCAVLFGAAFAFLAWFYRGGRPDLPPGGCASLWDRER